MFVSRVYGAVQRSSQLLPSISPVVAGCSMLAASFLPWLRDPLGVSYSAWMLPVNIGWQVSSAIFNYGLLCLCVAICCFLVAYVHWNPGKSGTVFLRNRHIASALCLLPVALFILQYLCIDLVQLNHLAQHKIQMLLIQQHYGYRIASQLFPITPFSLDISTIQGRLQLMIGVVSVGPLLTIVSAVLLAGFMQRSSIPLKPSKRKWMIGLCLLLLLCIPGRAAAAIVCSNQASQSLAEGNYGAALGWLDKAVFLNPALDQLAFYHTERGQALYYLYPQQQSNDSRAYLAFTYRWRGDNLDAYQQLLAIWHVQQNPPSWIIDEMSITLEQLAESANPLKVRASVLNATPSALKNDQVALNWLEALGQVDPDNVYTHYILARITYDLHSYSSCVAQIAVAMRLSSDADFLSSAYTYTALSHAGEGDYAGERAFLLLALQNDPGYHNNAAREEMSGLR